MSGASYEREIRTILRDEGWIVFRSAGSFDVDVIALRPDDHMLIEVKSTKAKVFRVGSSKRDREQFDVLNGYAQQGFNAFYYIRWKGVRENKWTRYKLPVKPYPIFRYHKNKEISK